MMKRGKTNRLICLMISGLMVLSGILALPDRAQALDVKTLAGENRFQTARIIAEQLSKDSNVENIVVASGRDFPDALAASVLANKLKAPIVLTDNTEEGSQDALSYISGAHITGTVPGLKAVHIIGGTGVIGSEFETRLKQLGIKQIERIGGANRYDTGLEIARKLVLDKHTPVVIASSDSYPDALSMSSFAAHKGWPILLTNGEDLTQGIKDYLLALEPSQIYIVGGTAVVSGTLEAQMQTLIPAAKLTRLAGKDRYETNALILQTFALNPGKIYYATGQDFADALAGSALASRTGDPILLVDPASQNIPTTAIPYLTRFLGRDLLPALVGLGGGVSLPPDMLKIADDLIRGKISLEELLKGERPSGPNQPTSAQEPSVTIPKAPTVPESSSNAVSVGGQHNVAGYSGGNVPVTNPSNQPSSAQEIPVVGSKENLLKLLKDMETNGEKYGIMTRVATPIGSGAIPPAMAAPEAAPNAPSTGKQQDAAAYSGTNVQVTGVDEADIIKTDGEYIYQLLANSGDGQSRLVISQAYPEKELKVVSRLTYPAEEFSPREIYVDKKHLVVIGDSHQTTVMPTTVLPKSTESSAELKALPPYSIMPIYLPKTRIFVYDLSNKANPTKIRELMVEGNYVSSRKIDSALYLVANKNINYYRILHDNEAADNPVYTDSLTGREEIAIPFSAIRCFPGTVEPNYLLVAGFNLESQEPLQVNAYLGSGNQIMASAANLYVAVTHYQWPTPLPADEATTGSAIIYPPGPNTTVYKFALNQGKTSYSGKGEVPGTLLNQFSLDEYEGYLRLATTTGFNWNTRQASENNVYVLKPDLSISGRLEKLAPGERIYAVRFMGKRGYMVTYKNVDPLFVLDLQDHAAPKVLGELKIPGYSNYLHPYDENHLIGIGKDSVEIPVYNSYTRETSNVAYYLGMKLSLFDVRDVKNPIERFKAGIGDRGTDSEILNNHKALLFSKEKSLLAFPVNVHEVKSGSTGYQGMPPYGELTFRGAYVYNLDLEKGFTLKGTISHPSPKVSQYPNKPYDNTAYDLGQVQRILYIGNNLYTVSEGMIKVNDLENLQEKGQLRVSQ